MTTVLVTGASGPLGRAAVAHLNAADGYKVVSTARRCNEALGTTISCDVTDQTQLEALLAQIQPDLILHLAATTSVDDLDVAHKTNVAPAQRILDFVHRTALAARVVLIGSAAEYGVVLPHENPITEERVLKPVSIYGVSKAWQTHLAGLYAARGVDVVCARIFNLWGAGMSDRLFAGRLQNQIAEVLAQRKAVIELGPLAAIRDYVSVERAAGQLLSIATYGKSGEIYHIASGVPTTMRDLTIQALAVHSLDFSIVREAPNLSNRRGYDVPVIYANLDKTNELENRTKPNTSFSGDASHSQ